mmetsp:Transcript_109593/g.194355  ORF Transcript_109593/g.194355 Transcript_109593/m.194355 type:complete len:247 (+) Transcript_109593:90-830(+)
MMMTLATPEQVSRPAMELKVDLGPMPVDEGVGSAINGLRDLFSRSELCDVLLEVDGRSFPAHCLVLAAVSPTFQQQLKEHNEAEAFKGFHSSKPKTIQLPGVAPEAVHAMLDCIYGPFAGAIREYNPLTDAINRDVLRLAQMFQLPQLQDQAARWLARDISISNVLDRLAMCEEFGLGSMREEILQELIADPEALASLVRDPKIRQVPAVLQDLLVQILSLLGVPGDQSTSKSRVPGGRQMKKAGA